MVCISVVATSDICAHSFYLTFEVFRLTNNYLVHREANEIAMAVIYLFTGPTAGPRPLATWFSRLTDFDYKLGISKGLLLKVLGEL